ncbi:MAG: M14 family metallocarboxypeptidase [Clostridia bacterium]|nr:M14 family metallocarboxypeptidase [Clostridia bacterium]
MGHIIETVEQDYNVLRREIYALIGKYPFLSLSRIGKSFMGKELLALRLGKCKRYVLIAAAFHGKERITSAIALRFVEDLCNCIVMNTALTGIPIRRALKERGLIVVPMVNPDGCDIAIHGEKACLSHAPRIKRLCGGHFEDWNANGRGVDINHNFNAGWHQLKLIEEEQGIFGPAPSRYGGCRPESEPETVALTNLCRRVNIEQVMALHTQGEEIYWRYGDKTPPQAERMAKILAASSGYKMADPAGTASHGGFKDWFIDQFGKPGFTVELGKGINPLPPSQIEQIYPAALELMALTLVM